MGACKSKHIDSKTEHEQYPIGFSYLTRLLNSSVYSNEELAKPLVLDINLSKISLSGDYSLDITLLEDENAPINIAHLKAVSSNKHNQVIYNNKVVINYYFQKAQTLMLTITEEKSRNIFIAREKIGNLASSNNGSPNLIYDENNIIELSIVSTFDADHFKENLKFGFSIAEESIKELNNTEVFLLVKKLASDYKYRDVYKTEEINFNGYIGTDNVNNNNNKDYKEINNNNDKNKDSSKELIGKNNNEIIHRGSQSKKEICSFRDFIIPKSLLISHIINNFNKNVGNSVIINNKDTKNKEDHGNTIKNDNDKEQYINLTNNFSVYKLLLTLQTHNTFKSFEPSGVEIMIEKESKFNINTSSISLPLVFISTKSLLSRLNKNSLTEHCSEQLKPSLVKLNLIISNIPNLSFTELLNQNLKLALTIGIDFTKGSSQTIDNEKSLHFYKGEQPNDYEKAMRSCGDILSLYNVIKEYPVYCFGGIPKNKSSPQHAYPLNSNYLNPSI